MGPPGDHHVFTLRQGHAKRLCCSEARKCVMAPSRRRLHDADEIGSPKFIHAVERFDGDSDLGDATLVIA